MDEPAIIVGEQTITGVLFTDALYHSKCAGCGYGLKWEADFDADGTRYSVRCCGYIYYISEPRTVDISREVDAP